MGRWAVEKEKCKIISASLLPKYGHILIYIISTFSPKIAVRALVELAVIICDNILFYILKVAL